MKGGGREPQRESLSVRLGGEEPVREEPGMEVPGMEEPESGMEEPEPVMEEPEPVMEEPVRQSHGIINYVQFNLHDYSEF